nr:MAG TPA: hypothetical protein [Caudoviricetes sp.]
MVLLIKKILIYILLLIKRLGLNINQNQMKSLQK